MIFVPASMALAITSKNIAQPKILIAGANVLLQVVLQRAQRMD